MKPWLALIALAVMTAIYIMIPVGLAARGYFRRRYKLADDDAGTEADDGVNASCP